MTPKQILDSFSETLMQDERILSAQERALLAALLQHAKAASGQSAETQDGVRAVIASAVGETVAQRAFAVLGGSIVERLLESSSASSTVSTSSRAGEIHAGGNPGAGDEPEPPVESPGPGVRAPRKPVGEPEPPVNAPQPPGVRPPQKAPHQPQPPSRKPMGEPEPPVHQVKTTVVGETSVALAERPSALPARCVVLDEFLAPQELEQLMRFTVEHEADFRTSEVVSPRSEGGMINYEHRRSRVLMDLAQHQELIQDRIKGVLPQVLQKLGMNEFSIADVETQITASNDGDFFRFHSDNGSERVSARHLTFVYFFHREPRQFEGGELRIHDAQLEGGTYVSEGSYQTIVPRQNQIVFFPCELMHEITPVKCPSGLFADGRFTLNGWLRQ
jgi:SM-20-related protein